MSDVNTYVPITTEVAGEPCPRGMMLAIYDDLLHPYPCKYVRLEDYDALHARVRELEQKLAEWELAATQGHPQPCTLGSLCPYCRIRELEQLLKHYATCDEHRQKEWRADLDRLYQVEVENAALRADLAHSREREEMHSQLRQDNHQEMLRLESENVALRAHVKKEPAMESEPCVWSENAEGWWETTCQNAFSLTAGTPSDNGMNFCLYCGRELHEQVYAREW